MDDEYIQISRMLMMVFEGFDQGLVTMVFIFCCTTDPAAWSL